MVKTITIDLILKTAIMLIKVIITKITTINTIIDLDKKINDYSLRKIKKMATKRGQINSTL